MTSEPTPKPKYPPRPIAPWPEQASCATPEPPLVTEITEPAPPPPQRANPDEVGGPKGPEPTRYGDWEKKGRCVDF
ncbi:DUF1674 domain-containing protein [Magnetospira thiophila]